jgi:5S rRNA maturation endonuclease (ribonuclease M5)
MTPVVFVLATLADYGLRPCGAGWSARCPAHDDRHASLTIAEGEDGRALLHCHRGCALADVLRALGLTARDLFVGPSAGTDGRTSYDYRDERGTLLFQVVRIPLPGGKTFRQRRPAGRDGWIWDVEGVRRVLYRLPELLATDPSETVFIVEGEKDADNLARRGLVATTNPGGALKWRRKYAEALRGRQVAILPDHDEVGRQHAAEVAWSLSGVAVSVRVVELSGLAKHGDVTDWLGGGHMVAKLLHLVRAAPIVRHTRMPRG